MEIVAPSINAIRIKHLIKGDVFMMFGVTFKVKGFKNGQMNYQLLSDSGRYEKVGQYSSRFVYLINDAWLRARRMQYIRVQETWKQFIK